MNDCLFQLSTYEFLRRSQTLFPINILHRDAVFGEHIALLRGGPTSGPGSGLFAGDTPSRSLPHLQVA